MKNTQFEEARKRHWKIMGEALVKNLTDKGFDAVYTGSAEEALEKILDLIPDGASVGVPGSVTIREVGAMEALEKKGCSVIHHWDPSLTGENRLQRLQDELLADFYLTSCNAVTRDGMIVGIDGNGNRVSGMAWGKNTIIFVIGMNKVVGSIDEAVSRTRNTATPPNAMRLNMTLPCTKAGRCVDCNSQERVCRALLILERATGGRKSHVIMVGESLGF
ncbi:MAG: LUD domain-containing protein [Synergistaceae bacterium]|nr:LUD domain-containing protein [Synergistaceae bacterium]